MAISTQCLKRLQKELKGVRDEGLDACPDARDILTWYFCFDGPSGTAYEGGEYLGKLRFPPNYPFAPPAIFMLTPSGRFQTDTRLCLSMSDFHPESWSPAWNVATIVRGVMSFMAEETQTYGSIQTDAATREKFAQHSRHANLKMSAFLASFPSRAAATRTALEHQQQQQQQQGAVAAVAPSSPSRTAAPAGRPSTASNTTAADAAGAAAVAAAGDDADPAIAPGWVPQRNFLVQGRQWVADGFGLLVGGGVRMAVEALLSPNGAPPAPAPANAAAANPPAPVGAPAAPVATAAAAALDAPAALPALQQQQPVGVAGGPDPWREEQLRRRLRQVLWLVMSLVLAVIAVALRQ